MNLPIRSIPWRGDEHEAESLLTREWLVTNGLGGYAAGTVAGVPTRRYHGLLISALAAPLGRTVMLTHLTERVRLGDGSHVRLGGVERVGGRLELHGAGNLREFRLEAGLPVWKFELAPGVVLEKRLLMPHLQNTVHVTYRLLSGPERVRLQLRPSMNFRPHETAVNHPLALPYVFTARDGQYEVASDALLPPLRLMLVGESSAFTVAGEKMPELLYRIEESRGYEYTGELWTPGYFRLDLLRGQSATLVASTESWDTIGALDPAEALRSELERRERLLSLTHPKARTGFAAELTLAADQFVITPAGRSQDAARAHAAGDEVRSIIAGYHWFTDWGRDTMISLEGLTLTTGRHTEAGYILRTFAHYVRDGLIPNLFPEGNTQGLYHTADATLWFFHALDRYLNVTNDKATLRHLLPTLSDIVAWHLRGTHFGIGVDPKDGLLRQGKEGYQLTWMDAKVGDWVVTPRRGKAVEINALWYNALRLLEGWLRDEKRLDEAERIADQAERTHASFNARFWNGRTGFLFDVVDGPEGDDPACRPNQILAIALKHPALDKGRWTAVLEAVRRELVTPVGLRSLSRSHPDYKARYYGDLRTRDAAYHQGTVWGWLAGPLIDAWLKVHPDDKAGARRFMEGFAAHLGESCIGSVSEIFDAEEPFTPRGCVAQAWSVAEALRCFVKVAD